MKSGYTFTWLTKSKEWINSRTVFTRPFEATTRALGMARKIDPNGNFFFLTDEHQSTVIKPQEAIDRLKKGHDVILINAIGVVAIKIFVVDIQ